MWKLQISLGQVFSLCLPINFSGHLQIGFDKEIISFKLEVNGFILEPEEMRLRLKPRIFAITRSTISTARMNCTYVEKTPLRCWNGLIDKFLRNAILLFFEDRNYLFLCIPIAISPTPQRKPEDIDQLSLVSEYHKLCRELALIQEITTNF